MAICRLPPLELKHGDWVVTAVSHEGYIVVVTKWGQLYRVEPERRL